MPEFAVNSKQDKQLDYLDICRYDTEPQRNELEGFRILVVGAGPAGLIFARAAATHGADVTVLEKAGDPRGQDPGYTDRSFNITLDNVGRQVLMDSRAWAGGIWLSGRAIHNFKDSGQIRYTRYGETSDTDLISIPRPILRQNLVQLAEDAGAHLTFRAPVTMADTTVGVVGYMDQRGRLQHLSGDLIIFSDGLHSLADSLIEDEQEAVYVRPEPRSYLTAMIEPDGTHELSFNHIHFWNESSSDAYTVGIPNGDRSISLLLTSHFLDLSEQAHPFATPQLAIKRLERDFPLLLASAPGVMQQLPLRQRGHFSYKSVGRYRVGDKGIIVGDAGCVVPPWAGFGANTAMYAAASLAHLLAAHNGDISLTLPIYEQQHVLLSGSLMSFVQDQGDFFSGPITDNPAGRSEAALGPLILRAKQQVHRRQNATAS